MKSILYLLIIVDCFLFLGRPISLLSKISVTGFTEFKNIGAPYFSFKGRITKVPFSETEMVKSGLVGFTNKNKLRKLFIYIAQYDRNNKATHEGLNLSKMKFKDFLSHFKVGLDSCEFLTFGLNVADNEKYVKI